jgi:putative ABC transport system permease protein
MDTLFQDMRYGFRVLLKSRGVSVAAVVALMLGIGANTAIFSVVNAVLLKPLPYPEPERLVRIYEKSPQFDAMSISYPNFLDWQERNQSFEQIAMFRYDGFNLAGGDAPERVQGRFVSANFFPILGVTPTTGRSFLPEEDKPGGNPAVILSNGLWQRRYGADPKLLGKSLAINGNDYTVIGILPADFSFYSQAELFLPLGAVDDVTRRSRDLHSGFQAIGRLKPGVTLAQASLEMENIALSLAREYPNTNIGYSVTLYSMHEDVVGSIRSALLVLVGAVSFVLLIACANVANLLLARAAARQKEIAIRTALGASRMRIMRQLLTESVLLSMTGGALGLLLALWGTDALVAAIPDAIPRAEDIRLDAGVLAFTLAVSLVTGIVFGLVPAMQASKPDLNESLKEGGRGSTSGRHRVRSLLVVSEVALALVLLIGAGLMIRSIMRLRDVAPGLDPRNVITMQIPLSSSVASEPAKIRTFYRQLLERVHDVPGVHSAAINSNMPLTGEDSEAPFWVGGGPRPAPEDLTFALMYPTSPGYLKAMGVPLLKGRFLAENDTEKSSTVVVIDELMARGLFADQDPIGKRITIPGIGQIPDISCEIVGVAGHVKHFGLDADSKSKIQYQFYIPFAQIPDLFIPMVATNVTLLARTQADPLSLSAAIKKEILAVDKDQPVNNVRTMEQILTASISQQRFSMLLLGIFAGVALILAAVGIYGVMSYSVAQRTHEIGIRLALGASRSDVLRLVVGQGMTLTAGGVGAGLLGAFFLTRLMESLLFAISATDPLTFIAIALLLAGVALVACFVPARRATKVDPCVALRYE